MPNMISAIEFGAHGDGSADDTTALQRALEASVARGQFLAIGPGTYRVTRPLKVSWRQNCGQLFGILGHGARILSEIAEGDVLTFACEATVRYLLVEGLSILGRGRERDGLVLSCPSTSHWLYNFCLRNVTVERCGRDGFLLDGDVFEGTIEDCYGQDNRRNGISFRNRANKAVVSAVRVYSGSFAQNGHCGAELIAEQGIAPPIDVAFTGSYFRNNGQAGLRAPNGCRRLDSCGFENNWESAEGFDAAVVHAGIEIDNFGTLTSCTGGSNSKQTHLIKSWVIGNLLIIDASMDWYGAAGREVRLGYFRGPGRVQTLNANGRLEFGDDIAKRHRAI
jgi:hypothetical protein